MPTLSNSIRFRGLHNWLSNSSWAMVGYVSVSAFIVYSCMYGFRKPYTVSTYSNQYFLGISYKVCLVIAQVLGYMCSKFYGIRFIAAMLPSKRANYILLFVSTAWLSLCLFAIIPAPYNIICMFINGLPLGMVFGLVFGYLEGRKTTEIMGAFLATSFIFASGLAKTVGKWLLLHVHVSDNWMPFVAGLFFIIPLCLAVWMLQQTPPPTATDIAERTSRKPMNNIERKAFLRQFGWAITPVVIAYVFFTIVRDFCEDFANELWIETGYQNNAVIFAQTSTIISLLVLVVIGSFFLVKNNYKAFTYAHYLVIIGIAIAAFSTFLLNQNIITTMVWMLFSVTGVYLAYLPFNCLYFERMLSTYKISGNVGFVMYIADAFGYLGTVAVLIIKEFIIIKHSWVYFFSMLFYVAAAAGIVLLLITLNIHKQLFNKFSENLSILQ